ncbi:4740fe66-36df-4c6e-b0b7-90dcfb5451ee-CDS [Sclerotinia trifoliorum]|uniref:4740fe66-36df-4c6e-b0b7-90dcfb5451ee-CDS n=1 Tax=Sclerotinia trifoliorum TaxID=28548 RepID=A0A8H2ZSE8_9HELO|nr:4740fe66-36df-4c6e-b0b7-90dcfb5451ee-CDS [Sclerotinia trifoliorum]
MMTREKSLSGFDGERIHTSTASENNISTSIPIRVITHNIRYATESPFKGEELWSIRCPRLCSELIFNSTVPETFICLQEVLHSQLVDIHDALNEGPGYKWSRLGVGRDDGKQAGEYSPIFYRPAVWDLVLYKTYWLSETPDKPSFGWDAGCIRLVTLGIFRHRSTNEIAVVMSTHLDNSGPISRQKSAELILEKVNHYKNAYAPAALLLAGDFNSPPDDEAYKTMTSSTSAMRDIRDLVPEKKRYGNEMTFTSFGYVDNTPTRIDFIFSAKDTMVKYETYAVLSNRYDDGVYLSDHRAVVADIQVSSTRARE